MANFRFNVAAVSKKYMINVYEYFTGLKKNTSSWNIYYPDKIIFYKNTAKCLQTRERKQSINLFEKYVIYEWVNKQSQPSLKVCIVYTKMTKNEINKTKNTQ